MFGYHNVRFDETTTRKHIMANVEVFGIKHFNIHTGDYDISNDRMATKEWFAKNDSFSAIEKTGVMIDEAFVGRDDPGLTNSDFDLSSVA